MTPALDALGDYRDVTSSPDGNRFVFDSSATGTQRRHVDPRLVRGVTSRFTFDTAQALDARLVARWPHTSSTRPGEGPGRPVDQGCLGHDAKPEPLLRQRGSEVRVRLVARRQVHALHLPGEGHAGSTSGRCR